MPLLLAVMPRFLMHTLGMPLSALPAQRGRTGGERGAVVATSQGQVEIRPPKVEVRSGVGAGDSFVAALVFGLASGWPLTDAARYGVAAAAAAVTTDATELCKRPTVDAFYAQIGGVLQPA